jgi:hypothetical protein
MLYVTDTPKDVATATRDLEEAVKRNKFGVLHVHDLQKTLKEKGVDFPNACRILEVCNPQRAVQVLTEYGDEHGPAVPDLRLSGRREDQDRHDPADCPPGPLPRGRRPQGGRGGGRAGDHAND